ncbi:MULTISPECIES: Na+/H+ antiporter subunit E [Haloferax]|uniref:Cation transporter n=1 Tax=Haloferax marinum TaxID=2666143 RepID=A0A6A8G3G6_9EURY|nr:MULTISPECIES: Na+/H+ antiporter subunit E [Haloferax]KAB1196712.1 Na+/H+ antiporter subunit E [Haloferax sp. CBA1150]MRW95720.1 cation transporter [Haloferax marinum]
MSRRWPLTGLALAILWLFVRGVELTPIRIAEEFVIGLGVGMGIAFFFRRFYSDETSVSRSARVAPFALLYLLTFLWELLTANVDVARRTLAPSMPIDPAVVEVPLRVRTPMAITTIANSITLTPGTLTMDYDDETNSLYVHSIDGSDPAAILEPIRRWEDYALVIFDEELKPGDPAPQAPAVGTTDHATATTGGEQHG